MCINLTRRVNTLRGQKTYQKWQKDVLARFAIKRRRKSDTIVTCVRKEGSDTLAAAMKIFANSVGITCAQTGRELQKLRLTELYEGRRGTLTLFARKRGGL